jgi:hypothetical protein
MASFFSKLFGGGRARRDPPDEELPTGDLKAGALYSIYNGDETRSFGIAKILVLEPPAVHLRVYNGHYAARPDHVDPETLSCGIPMDVFDGAEQGDNFEQFLATGDFGIGHMPVHLRDFLYGWQPVYIMDSPVTDEELEGYQIWKEDGGGIFGGM